jgi:ribose transport system permease protein
VETGGRREKPAERDRPSAIRRLGLQRYAILIVFAAMVAAFGADIPATFLSIGNLSNILGGQAVLFILVMAVILPTIMGDFVDLSLGSSLGLSAMTLAVLNVQHGTNVVLACLAGIGAAMVVGLVNVFFVVYFDNDPFIVTLGVMTIVQGIIYIISGNNSVGIVSTNLSDWVFNNSFLSIPLEFYYGLAIFVVVWYVLSFTPVGQKALVTGQSRDVARLTGVRVDRMRSWAFILGAAIAGTAGIAYAATNGTVDPTAGSSLILPAYAAVFLGATAIKPGRINALGSLIAVYFLATGTAGLELLGTASYYQQIFYGAALVAAVTIPKASRDRLFKRRRAA